MNEYFKQTIYYLLEGGSSTTKKAGIKEKLSKGVTPKKEEPSNNEYVLQLSLLYYIRVTLPPSRAILSLAEERVGYFFDYLNTELAILSHHLYFDAFQILLQHVWIIIIKVNSFFSFQVTQQIWYQFTATLSLFQCLKDFEDLLLPTSSDVDRYGHKNRY